MRDKRKARKKYDTLTIEGVTYKTLLTKKYKERKPYEEEDFSKVIAFISGTIADVFVKEGQEVEAGEPLVILEAMKMKNIIQSPIDGKVIGINVKKEEKVIKGQLLIEME